MSVPYEDLLVLGDTQVGSIFGIWPEGYVLSDGGTYLPNPGQQYLWACWNHLAKRISRTQRDGQTNITGLVFMGDATDGQQFKQGATEAIVTRMADQIGAFLEVMQVVKEALPRVPIYGIQGSEYHDGRAADAFEGAMASLGAVEYSGVGSGRFSHEVLDLTVPGSGVTINFAHHISVLTGLYRAVAIDREAIWSALAGKEGQLPKADVIVRAHVHHFVHVEHASKHGIIVPGWQLQTRFMRRHSVYRMVPDLGAVVIRIWKEESWFDDKIQVFKLRYGLPPVRPHVHQHGGA